MTADSFRPQYDKCQCGQGEYCAYCTERVWRERQEASRYAPPAAQRKFDATVDEGGGSFGKLPIRESSTVATEADSYADTPLEIRMTTHGATVELHRNHFVPLLKVVRDAKQRCLHEKDAALFREIEHRLEKAERLAQWPKT